jgi:hypothetical protein
MNKKQQTGQAGTARSPYLSFREAVRPAIFAHRLLVTETERAEAQARDRQERAGRLAEVASQILMLTRELLRKAGLSYIANVSPEAQKRAAHGLGYQGSLHDAFADAAMFWSEIVGSCLALADVLLREGRLDDARGLAAALADAGESATARELHRRLEDAVRHKYKQRLSEIHGNMQPTAIESALETLAEAVSEIPESLARDTWLRSYLPALAHSMRTRINPPQESYYNFSNNLAMIELGGTGASLATDVSVIAATFQTNRRYQ